MKIILNFLKKLYNWNIKNNNFKYFSYCLKSNKYKLIYIYMKNKLKKYTIGAITIGSITTFINKSEKNIKGNWNFFWKLWIMRKIIMK